MILRGRLFGNQDFADFSVSGTQCPGYKSDLLIDKKDLLSHKGRLDTTTTTTPTAYRERDFLIIEQHFLIIVAAPSYHKAALSYQKAAPSYHFKQHLLTKQHFLTTPTL